MADVSTLTTYRRGLEHIHQAWPGFLELRTERLRQQARHGMAAEKVAENIVEDLMTGVLDWSVGDLNNQVHFSDLVLTHLGISYLIVETKRPGALVWNHRALEAALEQARRYASEQRVSCVAVSDGTMFYAADVVHGGLRDRVFCRLDAAKPAEELWWPSVHGIYRQRPSKGAVSGLVPDAEVGAHSFAHATDSLLHPKYHLPARCFAYVGDAARTNTWKLPFRLADGTVDTKRLPKAIGAILTNYRGAKVQAIPEEAIPDVLRRLAKAAQSLGHMPPAATSPAPVYRELADVLARLGARGPIGPESKRSAGSKDRSHVARPPRRAQPNLDSFA